MAKASTTAILRFTVMVIIIQICNGLNLTSLIDSFSFEPAQADDCSGGPRGPRDPTMDCEQNSFDGWDVEISDKLKDDGRLPGVSRHDKTTKYLMNTTEWCESIRPCPLQFGTITASHNSNEASKLIDQKRSSWTSGAVSRSAMTSGGVWIQFTLATKPLALGYVMFKPSDDVTNIRFEGSTDGSSWEDIIIDADDSDKYLWSFKVMISRTERVKAYISFRLSIVETTWSQSGSESGIVSIENFQLCFIDDLEDLNDNPYVTSPPWIPDPKAKPFSSTRWGRNWHERYAFTGPSVAWCSSYVYADRANRGVLNKPQYIGYSFPLPRVIRKIRLMGSHQAKWMKHHPKDFSFQGCNEIDVKTCNDEQSWTTLKTVSLRSFRSINREEELVIPEQNLAAYLHYRIYVTKTGWSAQGRTGGYVIMRALRFC